MKDLLNEKGLSYTLTKINKEFTKYINQHLEQYNITRSEAPILLSLYKKDGVTQEYLSKKYHLNEATITRAIKRMKTKEIIKRKEDLEDKRKKLVYITPKGKEISENILKVQGEFEKELFKTFTNEELETFKKLTEKLLKSLYEI